jgi:hypothetical protein
MLLNIDREKRMHAMTYACSYEVPATIEMYREVRRLIGDDKPDGLVAHVVVRSDRGLRHLEVWDTEDAWTRFHAQRVEPAVHTVLSAAGLTEMPPDPPVDELELVDVWLGN